MYFRPTPISWRNYHFLVMGTPDDHSMKKVLVDLKEYKVKLMIRSCELTYTEESLINAGIKVEVITLFSLGSSEKNLFL